MTDPTPTTRVRPEHLATPDRAAAFWLELSAFGRDLTAVEFHRNGGEHKWYRPTGASLARLMSLLDAMCVSVYEHGCRIVAWRERVDPGEMDLEELFEEVRND